MTAADPAGFAIDTAWELDCTYAAEPWTFAETWREAIDRHWEARVRERPHLFDGRVLMQTRGGMERRADGRAMFRASYTDVAFRAFMAWRDFGHPLPGFRNGFGMAALQGADGAFLLGEMNHHTANAGRVYFPSGTPDRSDIVESRVDIAGSIQRELVEETGLDPASLAFDQDFTVIHDALRVCFMQRVRAAEDADVLARRINATLAGQELPELARMHVVRTAADITPAMPPFVVAYLLRQLPGGAQPG